MGSSQHSGPPGSQLHTFFIATWTQENLEWGLKIFDNADLSRARGIVGGGGDHGGGGGGRCDEGGGGGCGARHEGLRHPQQVAAASLGQPPLLLRLLPLLLLVLLDGGHGDLRSSLHNIIQLYPIISDLLTPRTSSALRCVTCRATSFDYFRYENAR